MSSSPAAIPSACSGLRSTSIALSTAAFDANDPAALKRFFDGLAGPIDHVLITAGGPHYGPMLEMDSDQVREAITDHAVLALEVARHAVGKMRPGGTLLLIGGTGGRRVRRELGIMPSPPQCFPRSPRLLRWSWLRFGST